MSNGDTSTPPLKEMKNNMKTLVGIRPTGYLHLGHYFSVIKPALKYNADVLIADLHAPDSEIELEDFEHELRSYGLGNIISQALDDVLYFRLLQLASFGDLERMTQFKSGKKNPHLFCYPVLMACDLVGYDRVVVGEDQRQHIEFARELARKYEKKYGELKMPTPIYSEVKVMSLTEPEKKMSKSEPKGCLFLGDPETKEKLKKAVTNEAGRKNLENLYREFVGEPPEMNSKLKENLAEALIKKFG